MGVYHPHPEYHHIKKENIGLIEVMGLAVLPARLAKEMALLKDTLCSGGSVRQVPELASHAAWAESILQRHPEFSAACADQILQDEIGAVLNRFYWMLASSNGMRQVKKPFSVLSNK